MPLDAVCLRAVVNELTPQLAGARIEKIQQPARDQVVLLLRGSRRLLLCANPNQPRIHMTEQLRDNPSQPPMFCMLLRKHLQGAKICSITSPDLERMVTIECDTTDEMGVQSKKYLACELMGKYSNIILYGADGRIIDAVRRIDGDISGKRQVLPGLFYHQPPPQDKINLLPV